MAQSHNITSTDVESNIIPVYETIGDRTSEDYDDIEMQPCVSNVNVNVENDEEKLPDKKHKIVLKKNVCIGTIVVITVLVIVSAVVAYVFLSPKTQGGSCKSYTDISNGQIVRSTGSRHGDTLEFQCDKNSKLIGTNTITCLSSDVWSADPHCVLKECGKFVLTQHMAARSDANLTTIGSVISLFCEKGFQLSGNSSVICQTDEEWSTSPTCKHVDCGSPMVIRNAKQYRLKKTPYNSSFTVECADGYTLIGTETVTCNIDGQWDDLPMCEIVSCGIPNIPVHASIRNLTGTSFQSTVTLKCDEGYSMHGNSESSCTSSGNWTDLPSCKGGSCKSYTDISNGQIVRSTGSRHGDTLEFQCDKNSKLIGTNTITCLSSDVWSADPHCVLKECGKFVLTQHMAARSDANLTTIGSVISLFCEKGFQLSGNSSVICQTDEEWSTSPTCKHVDCGSPMVIRNAKQYRLKKTPYNSSFTVECADGYTLIGTETVTCNIDGQWDDLPMCEIVSCGIPNIPVHASIRNLTGTSFQSTVTLKCDEGYSMHGNSESSCTSSGNWTDLPSCKDINECGSNPCLHGSCTDLVDGYNCTCFAGYSGLSCQTETDECSPDPCIHGTCIDGIGNYSCSCNDGFSGTDCEHDNLITDCVDILRYNGSSPDGIYTVRTWKSHQLIKVYCDMTTDGGGWTVFQNRFDGSIDFYRNFSEYGTGFGNLTTEFWLGLRNIKEIADQDKTDLRIDLEAANGTKAYETSDSFYLSPGPAYTLHIGSTIASTIASLHISSSGVSSVGQYHNGSDFSTYDRDADSYSKNCAVLRHGAWWYNGCSWANLNGQYVTPGTHNIKSMTYLTFMYTESLKTSRMMMRRE